MAKTLYFLIIFIPIILFAQNPKYDFAKSYLENGQYEDAARLFKDLYDESPNKIEYFAGLVESYRLLGKNAELIPIVNKQLKRDYHHVLDALLGELYYKTGEKEKAIAHWNSIIEKDKDNINAYSSVSNALTLNREFKEAIKLLIIAKDKFNNPELNDKLIKLYISDNNYKEGSLLVIESLGKDKDLVKAQGHLYAFMTNDESNAYLKSYLLSLSDKNPNDIYIQELIAWFFRTTNDLASAFKIYQRLDELKNVNGREILTFADISRKDGHYQEALIAYELLMDNVKYERYKRNAIYGYALTLEDKIDDNIKVSEKQAKEIINRYDDLIKINANSNEAADAMYRIAMIKKNWLNDFKGSNKDLRELMEKFPRSPIAAQAGLRIGLNFQEMGELSKSQEILQEVYSYHTNNNRNIVSEVEFALAKTIYFSGNIDSATILFNSLIHNEKDDISNDALEKLMLINENKDVPQALSEYAKADYFRFQNKHEQAIKSFNGVVKVYPETKLAQRSIINISRILLKDKKYSEIISLLEDFRFKYATSIFSDEALLLLSEAYHLSGNNDKAIEKLTEILVDFNKSIYIQDVRDRIRKYRKDI